jgi:hypothetical protein
VNTPYTFVAFRILAATVTLLVLLVIGFGLGGLGPAGGLSALTDHAIGWFDANTAVGLL